MIDNTIKLILLFSFCSFMLNAQESPLAVFDNLLHKSWEAEGTWGDGSKFKQEITFEKGLENHIIITKSKGFTNKEQSEYGWRNHGIRQYDAASKSVKFWEFDVFGGVTEGKVWSEDKSIYYQYPYGESVVTDAWEYVDDWTYNFKVGEYVDGEWKETYLSTQFKADKPKTMEDELPYAEIPSYPYEYNAATVSARMIDGLGFRYYWATKDLREEDLNYKPSETNRTTAETLDHLYGLATMIWNSAKQQPNVRPKPKEDPMTFEEQRARTLKRLKEASDLLRTRTSSEMQQFDIVFQRGEQSSSVPFWHQINGPIADALWHTGQIVAFRRASGNPM
ncbi:MAG: hypothetical protein AAFO82_20580, partial [Bacteroidota bacterium]